MEGDGLLSKQMIKFNRNSGEAYRMQFQFSAASSMPKRVNSKKGDMRYSCDKNITHGYVIWLMVK